MKSVTEPQNFFKVEFLRKIKLFLVLCMIGLVTLSSCKKDDDDDLEVKPSMEGELGYTLPVFAEVKTEYELKGGGIIRPTQDSVSYEWISTDLFIGGTDTIKGATCKIVIPDSIATFSLTLSATADGYYDMSNTQYITSIKLGPDGSLVDYILPEEKITDPRDGQEYAITEIGSLLWFAENLNWAGAGSGYAKADVMGEILGRLYTWNDATGGVSGSGLGGGPQGVCPEGWSIPTKEDWEDFGKALNGGKDISFDQNWAGLGDNVMINSKLNGEKFWPYSPSCNPENMFGWAALSAGSGTNNYNNFTGLSYYGFWWSATELTENQAAYRYIYCNLPDFNTNYTYKDGFAASVRCVKVK